MGRPAEQAESLPHALGITPALHHPLNPVLASLRTLHYTHSVQWNETQRELSTVIELTGEIDLQNSPALRQTLKDKAASKCPALVLDFSKVEYVDSSGLATLVEYVRDAQAFDGKFALVGVGQRVRSIIELVRLDELLKMHPSVIEAESSFLPA